MNTLTKAMLVISFLVITSSGRFLRAPEEEQETLGREAEDAEKASQEKLLKEKLDKAKKQALESQKELLKKIARIDYTSISTILSTGQNIQTLSPFTLKLLLGTMPEHAAEIIAPATLSALSTEQMRELPGAFLGFLALYNPAKMTTLTDAFLAKGFGARGNNISTALSLLAGLRESIAKQIVGGTEAQVHEIEGVIATPENEAETLEKAEIIERQYAFLRSTIIDACIAHGLVNETFIKALIDSKDDLLTDIHALSIAGKSATENTQRLDSISRLITSLKKIAAANASNVKLVNFCADLLNNFHPDALVDVINRDPTMARTLADLVHVVQNGAPARGIIALARTLGRMFDNARVRIAFQMACAANLDTLVSQLRSGTVTTAQLDDRNLMELLDAFVGKEMNGFDGLKTIVESLDRDTSQDRSWVTMAYVTSMLKTAKTPDEKISAMHAFYAHAKTVGQLINSFNPIDEARRHTIEDLLSAAEATDKSLGESVERGPNVQKFLKDRYTKRLADFSAKTKARKVRVALKAAPINLESLSEESLTKLVRDDPESFVREMQTLREVTTEEATEKSTGDTVKRNPFATLSLEQLRALIVTLSDAPVVKQYRALDETALVEMLNRARGALRVLEHEGRLLDLDDPKYEEYAAYNQETRHDMIKLVSVLTGLIDPTRLDKTLSKRFLGVFSDVLSMPTTSVEGGPELISNLVDMFTPRVLSQLNAESIGALEKLLKMIPSSDNYITSLRQNNVPGDEIEGYLKPYVTMRASVDQLARRIDAVKNPARRSETAEPSGAVAARTAQEVERLVKRYQQLPAPASTGSVAKIS